MTVSAERIAHLNSRAVFHKSGVGFELREDGKVDVTRDRRRIRLAAGNGFYAQDFVNGEMFEYFFGAVVPQPGNETLADFSEPAHHTLTINGMRLFFPSFPEGPIDAPLHIKYLKPQPGETVLDLGGYSGLSAILFSQAVGPQGRVIVLEPDPVNQAAFEKNVVDRPNVTLERKAVAGRSGELWFSSEGNMGSMLVADPSAARDRLVKVEATTLDDVLDAHGLDRVDIIKMDVEGAEYDIFDHIGDFLTRRPARWMCELHADPDFDNRYNYKRIRRHFELAGYMTHHVNEGPGRFMPMIYAEPMRG